MYSCLFPRQRGFVIAWLLLAAATATTFAQETTADQKAPAASLPKLEAGSVTLPYAELRTLWEAAQPKPVAPAPIMTPSPVAFSVQAARYAVDLGGDARQATGQAVFDVLDLADGWTSVPLLPVGEARLTGIEPEGTLVTVRDGFYTLLLDAPGRRAVTLRFTADLPEGRTPTTRSLHLSGPAALVNELDLTGVPDGWVADVPGSTRDATSGPGARFHLSAGQGLALDLASEQASKPVPPAPSVWQAEAQAVVRYDEGQLHFTTRLRISADAGAGLTLALTLPASAGILSVTGVDLDHWRAVKADAGDVRRVDVVWKTADVLRRELVLDYELPQTTPEGDWRLVSPQVVPENGRLGSALYALPTMEGTEFVAPQNGAALPAADARQVPGWIAKEIDGGNFVVLPAAQPAPADNASSSVRARRLPLLRTAQATVDESRFHTRLVTDGALLTEGEMSVRHDGPLTLDLSLPEGAQLLTCAVDGRNALPVDRGNGRLDLTLPAGTANRVRLSYTSRQTPMSPVSGQTALSLPQTDLFVQSLTWDLQIPDEYELTALEGNVEVSAAANAAPGIHLRKELLKAERPAAELFYQKRAVAP